MVLENIHTPHNRGSLEILRERGVLKAKMFKGMYEPKLEFLEGWGVGFKPKKPSVGEVWTFAGITQYCAAHSHSHSLAQCFLFTSGLKIVCLGKVLYEPSVTNP